MSYTPTEWQTGDVITAEKLNNMESGIAGATEVLLVNVIYDGMAPQSLDKKCADIKNALAAGKLLTCRAVLPTEEETPYIFFTVAGCVFHAVGGCAIDLIMPGGTTTGQFTADTDNDYPTYNNQ